MSSRYSSESREQAPSYRPISSIISPGLPDDQFRTFQKRQNRDRLEAHFSHCSSSSSDSRSNSSLNSSSSSSSICSCSQTSYQDVGLSQTERCRISEIKNATRTALGPNFDFTDDSYRNLELYRAASTVCTSEHGRIGGRCEDPIPQHYIDEYHKRSREDDEKHEQDQYRSDCTSGALWHIHDPLEIDVTDMRPLTSHHKLPRYSTPPEQTNSSLHDELHESRPQLVSKFSFDSDISEKRGFFSRRR